FRATALFVFCRPHAFAEILVCKISYRNGFVASVFLCAEKNEAPHDTSDLWAYLSNL
mgnify:CR=1